MEDAFSKYDLDVEGATLFEDDLDIEAVALAVKFLALANVIIVKMMHQKYNIVNDPTCYPTFNRLFYSFTKFWNVGLGCSVANIDDKLVI